MFDFLSRLKKRHLLWGALACYIVISVLTFGPVIEIYGEDYFFIQKETIEKNPYVSPVFVRDSYYLEIPFVIWFAFTKDNGKNLRIEFLRSFSYDGTTSKPKVNNNYLDDIAGIKINLLKYHTKEGKIFNLLECKNLKSNSKYIEMYFPHKISSGDHLYIRGVCKLKNGSEINFDYEYKVKIEPFKMYFSLRILDGWE